MSINNWLTNNLHLIGYVVIECPLSAKELQAQTCIRFLKRFLAHFTLSCGYKIHWIYWSLKLYGAFVCGFWHSVMSLAFRFHLTSPVSKWRCQKCLILCHYFARCANFFHTTSKIYISSCTSFRIFKLDSEFLNLISSLITVVLIQKVPISQKFYQVVTYNLISLQILQIAK